MTKGFRSFEDLEKHLYERHANETNNFTCHHCPEEVELMKHFRFHGRLVAECTMRNQEFESN